MKAFLFLFGCIQMGQLEKSLEYNETELSLILKGLYPISGLNDYQMRGTLGFIQAF